MGKDKQLDLKVRETLNCPADYIEKPVRIWVDKKNAIDGFIFRFITENGKRMIVIRTEDKREITCKRYWNIQPLGEWSMAILEAYEQLALNDLDKRSGSKEAANRIKDKMVSRAEAGDPEVAEYLRTQPPQKPESAKGTLDPKTILNARHEVTIARIEGETLSAGEAFRVAGKVLNKSAKTVENHYYKKPEESENS